MVRIRTPRNIAARAPVTAASPREYTLAVDAADVLNKRLRAFSD
jgi:hypothetical protein